MTVKAHIDAQRGLLAGVGTVYVTRAADTATYPYVVLHPDQGTAEASSLALASNRRLWRFQTTVAAVGWEQLATWAQKVEAALLDVAPAVAGDHCSPIRNDVSMMFDRDEDLPTPLFVGRAVWSYYSHPA